MIALARAPVTTRAFTVPPPRKPPSLLKLTITSSARLVAVMVGRISLMAASITLSGMSGDDSRTVCPTLRRGPALSGNGRCARSCWRPTSRNMRSPTFT